MKSLKKMMALALAMVMVLAMSATVFAAPAATAPKGTIEITSPKTDPNADNTYYDAYRIFDMTTNGTKGADGNYTAVAYTINSAWADFFKAGAPGAAYLVDTNSGDLNSITVNDATKYINITDSNVATFAKEAFDYAQKNSIAATKTETVAKDATTVKFTDLDLGYYMVYPRGASVQSGDYTSIVSITNTAPDGKVAQKAEWPGLTKVADDISTEVGQKVTYTLGSKVPDTTGYTKYEFTFKDKTTAGLTYDGNDSVTVKIGGTELTAETDYTFAASPSDGNDFELTINLLKNNGTTAAPEWVAKYTYDAAIEITYTATVNEAAVTKIDENHATLTYHNNPKDEDSKDTTPPVEVPTYSSKLIINKVDGASTTTPLEGAKFVLKAKTIGTVTGDSHETDLAVGKYYFYDSTAKDVKWVEITGTPTLAELAARTDITVVTTDAQGKANFDGLEDGTYELVEVEAPKGYNLLTSPVEVVIDGADATEADLSPLTVTTPVENNSGTQLPSTGGIGTTIFYIIGAILVLGAGILLVTRRRMNAN